jgi:hypothetical protein
MEQALLLNNTKHHLLSLFCQIYGRDKVARKCLIICLFIGW